MEKAKFIDAVVKLNKGTLDWKSLVELAEYMEYILPVIPEAVKLGFKKPSNYQSYNAKFEKSMIYLKKKSNLRAEERALNIELSEIRKEKRELVKDLKALYNADSIQELRRLSKLEILTEEETERMDNLEDDIKDNLSDTKEVKAKITENENLAEIKRTARAKRPSLMDRLGE